MNNKQFKVSNPSTYYSLNDIKRVIDLDTYTNYYLLIFSISKLPEDERKELYYHIKDIIQSGKNNVAIKSIEVKIKNLLFNFIRKYARTRIISPTP